jgi:DNA-binding NarL/FixJ family response regulator
VVLADDHTLFRQGIRELLCTDADLEVVGEASSGDEVLAVVGEHQPDVLLLDVEMPGPGAKALISRLGRTSPRTAIAILTMHESPALVHALLDGGATAYLVKSIGREELIATVHSLARNNENVLLSVPRATLESLERGEARQNMLSGRELEVLELVAKALSNGQIASRLFISEGTVKRHLTNIYSKLGATSRLDAVKKAVRAKLIDGLDT